MGKIIKISTCNRCPNNSDETYCEFATIEDKIPDNCPLEDEVSIPLFNQRPKGFEIRLMEDKNMPLDRALMFVHPSILPKQK